MLYVVPGIAVVQHTFWKEPKSKYRGLLWAIWFPLELLGSAFLCEINHRQHMSECALFSFNKTLFTKTAIGHMGGSVG